MTLKTPEKFLQIVAHYEDCLEKHGDSHLGVDWPNRRDADKRYEVMLGLILSRGSGPVSLLDFGCGAGHLLSYLEGLSGFQVAYTGLDISEKFVTLCRNKFPRSSFICGDLLKSDFVLPQFDYVVMNGVFTEKRDLSFEEMWDYFQRMIIKTFAHTKQGIAFNVMSKQVDWEREDLFHLPLDLLADFLTKKVSRHFVVRNDYGLYEYTVYVYR